MMEVRGLRRRFEYNKHLRMAHRRRGNSNEAAVFKLRVKTLSAGISQ